MPRHPLAEVFGYPMDNFTPEAERYRKNRLCPFNNKVPNCTKDKADDPLGVCSIYDSNNIPTITCPIRFREDWLIAEDAANFFFPSGTRWTSLTEIRLNDVQGKSAGNIDVVPVSYGQDGNLTDFGALEVQAVYISGNIRGPFAYYMADPRSRYDMDWRSRRLYPRPDYLSSSRKRLAPQLIYKGGILNGWGKKMAVAVHSAFYNTIPALPEVSDTEADIAWLIYDLVLDQEQNVYNLTRNRIVHTAFLAALEKITKAEPGSVSGFIKLLQDKLAEKLVNGESAPDTPTIGDFIDQNSE